MPLSRILALMAAVLIAVPAVAGSLSTEVNGLRNGTLIRHDDDAAATGDIFSIVQILQERGADTGLIQPPGIGDDDGLLYAVASDNGNPDEESSTQVLLDTWMFDGSANWVFNGNSVTTLTVTNNTGGNAQFWFDYSLSPAFLGITDFEPGAAQVEVGYEAEIFVDGASEFLASSSILGDVNGGIITSTTLPGPLANFPVLFPANQAAYFDQGAAGSINLGILAPGESRQVITDLYGWVNTPGFELGGALNVGLDGAVRFQPTGPPFEPPIPEPATAALLGLGALGIVFRKRVVL